MTGKYKKPMFRKGQDVMGMKFSKKNDVLLGETIKKEKPSIIGIKK